MLGFKTLITSPISVSASIKGWDCFNATNLAAVPAKWLPLFSLVFAIECPGIFMIAKNLGNWITFKSFKT